MYSFRMHNSTEFEYI